MPQIPLIRLPADETQPLDRRVLCATSTPWFVLWANLLELPAEPLDPYYAAVHTHTAGSNDLNGLIVPTQGYNHLNLKTRLTPQAITTAAVVRVYGGISKKRGQGRVNLTQPQDWDNANFDSNFAALTGDYEWFPLYNPRDGEVDQDFGTDFDLEKTETASGDAAFREQHGDKYVYLNGCDVALVLPQTAIAGPTAALLLGRLSS